MNITSSILVLRARGLAIIFLALSFFGSVCAQDPLKAVMTMGFGDVAEIKKRAEAGDAGAQVALGDTLLHRLNATEAFQWYRKAAIQGNAEGEYQAGGMLLFGWFGNSNLADRVEGLRWTFMAAKGRYAPAYWNMSRAFQEGVGTSTDPIAAYAWLKLYSETSAGSIVGRVHMNDMALKMNAADLQRGQNLAARFRAGDWQPPVVRVIPDSDPRLKLTGIAFGVTGLAVINGKTLEEGDSANIPFKPSSLRLKCIKIAEDSVTVLIEGEDQPRTLRLSH